MVLVARRPDRLEEVSKKVRESNPDTEVLVIAADLSKPGERGALVEKTRDAGFVPDMLINNAGLGDYGEFSTAAWEDIDRMLRVNIEALTHMSHLFAPEMMKGGFGVILNVSSLASTLAIPDFAVYAATKAYVSSFTEALRIELKEHGVSVLSLCPGPVKTEFGEVARREGESRGMPPAHKSFYVSKEQVVAESLSGIHRGRARVFPGLQVAATGLIIGALPLAVLRVLMGYRPRK